MITAIPRHSNRVRRPTPYTKGPGSPVARAARRASRAARARKPLLETVTAPTWILLLLATIGLVFLAYLSLAAQATQASYEINRLTAQQQQLQEDQGQLRYQVARAEAAIRVDQQAQAMGMVHPAKWVYLPNAGDPIALAGGQGSGQEHPSSWVDRLAMVMGATAAEAETR
ncbi:MAG: hypothetical protein ACYDAY_03600 [Candidatus Dormibacteria bacterium]